VAGRRQKCIRRGRDNKHDNRKRAAASTDADYRQHEIRIQLPRRLLRRVLRATYEFNLIRERSAGCRGSHGVARSYRVSLSSAGEIQSARVHSRAEARYLLGLLALKAVSLSSFIFSTTRLEEVRAIRKTFEIRSSPRERCRINERCRCAEGRRERNSGFEISIPKILPFAERDETGYRFNVSPPRTIRKSSQ